MASPVDILTDASPVWDSDAHWLQQLQDSLALIDGEIWDESHSAHPGARHRIVDLKICARDRRRQISALRMRAEAFGS